MTSPYTYLAGGVYTLLSLLILMTAAALSYGAGNAQSSSLYGENSEAGGTAKINGISMYYEVYGQGEPMVLIHGSGQSIAAMAPQIAHFAKDYRVLVADSRGHGKSGLGDGELTYVQMADDWADLMDHVGMKKVNLIGWSDGGNIGLTLAIRRPEKINKLAVMGANMQPDESAVESWAVAWVAKETKHINDMLAAGDKTQDWVTLKQHFTLLREQPDISVEQLGSITAPVLVMAGDRDVIRGEHTLLMYQSIPKSHLAIFPGETHYTPSNDPALFNATVDRFMRQPFTRPDTRDLF